MYNSLINLCTCIYSEPRSPDQIEIKIGLWKRFLKKPTYLRMETYTTDEEACVTWVHWGEFHHGKYRRGYDERGAEGEGEDNGDNCGIHDQGQCKRPEKRVSTITL